MNETVIIHKIKLINAYSSKQTNIYITHTTEIFRRLRDT